MLTLNFQDALRHALRLHEAGRFEEAEALYRQVLQQDPANAPALHYLGLAAHQAGRSQEALDLIARSIQSNPIAPHYRNNLGKVLRELGRYDDAIAAYDEAIRLKPDYAEAFNNRGVALTHQRRHDEAEASFKRSIELGAGPETIRSLGDLCREQKKYDLAIRYYYQVLALKPDSSEAHNGLAICYGEQGRVDQAIRAGQKAVAIRPDFADAYNNLGTSYGKKRRFRHAIEALRRAVDLDPENAEALSNLGSALQEKGYFEEAAECCRKAIALKPEFRQAQIHLAGILTKQGRAEEAIAITQRLLRDDPEYIEALLTLGHAYMSVNQVDAAIAACERAIVLEPRSAVAYWNKALAILVTGDLARGWSEYEWRWSTDDLLSRSRRHYKQPRWDGGPLDGQTIFLYTEQGFGDTLQFARYVPMVVQRGGRVVLECQKELKSLLSTMPGVAEILSPGDPLPEFATEAPLLSLPMIFDTTLATIPARVPYLLPRQSLVMDWKERLAVPASETRAPRRRVGLVWAGNSGHKNDHNRSMSIAALAPLAAIDGIRFFSLQKGRGAEQLADAPAGLNPVDLGEQLTSFADTAAVIANLDQVISVDTAVAHLAGAMGKPVYLLLPFAPDWRWLLDRTDSPWYPSMRLFRQPRPGDWSSVIASVVDHLRR